MICVEKLLTSVPVTAANAFFAEHAVGVASQTAKSANLVVDTDSPPAPSKALKLLGRPAHPNKI